MRSLRLIRRLALALLLGAVTGGRSLAQEPASEPAPNPDAAGPDIPVPDEIAPPPGIEAIEVTGERLNDANVQDEAQAITAFTGADLDKANIVSVDSLQFNVPGLHVGQSANAPIITLRGIGTENSSLTGEPGVAFHIDGINFGRPAAARVAFFDLETLDVKRGPQGLLGGKNSTSGSINLITRKPSDEYEVSGDVLFGNYDRVRIRGAVNVPLGEYAAARLAFYQENRDGFLDNKNVGPGEDPFDADDLGLRGHLKLTPADDLELMFSYNYYRQDGTGPQSDSIPIPRTHACGVNQRTIDSRSGLLLPATPLLKPSVMPFSAACSTLLGVFAGRIPDPANPSRLTNAYADPFTGKIIQGTNPQTGNPVLGQFIFVPATEDGDPRAIYLDLSSSQRNRYWGWTTTTTWDAPALPALGETQLKLLGGFQTISNQFGQDFDATDRPLSGYTLDPDESDQYSGELQWSGTALAERLDWQASLFHLHEKAQRDVSAPTLIPGALAGLASTQTTDNKAYGAGLHGTFALTDALSLSLGARMVKDRKSTWLLREALAESNENRFRGCQGRLLITTDLRGRFIPVLPNEECSETYRGKMWGAGLEFRPFGDDHLLYSRIDRGYKSGGFRAGTVGEYAPERIWAYALGTKSEFFDQRLRVNLEGFFYAYDSLQLVILDGLALRTENSDARMWGADLEAVASPIDGLNLSVVLSHIQTETRDYFSLDPADAGPAQLPRLSAREAAETNARDGLGGATVFGDMQVCYDTDTPSNTTPPVRCGEVGDRDGLDDFSANDLSRAPEWKLTLSGDYEIPLGRFGSLTPRVQYTWQDDTYYRAFNRDFDLQEAYHLTDAKLTWNSPEDAWAVEVFVQNIEDKAAMQNVLVGPREFGAPPFAWYNPPRFYGVQIGFKY